jgi:hypothetical protein
MIILLVRTPAKILKITENCSLLAKPSNISPYAPGWEQGRDNELALMMIS